MEFLISVALLCGPGINFDATKSRRTINEYKTCIKDHIKCVNNEIKKDNSVTKKEALVTCILESK